MSAFLRRWGIILSLTLAATLVPVAMGRFMPFLVSLETWLSDFRIATLLPAEAQQAEIIFVAINEETVSRFPYRSPVDREFLADLLRTLEQKGAGAIFLDLLLDSPTEPDKDARLQQVMTGLKIPLVVSYGGAAEGLTPKQVTFLDNFVPPALRGAANLEKDPYDGIVRTIYVGKPDSGEDKARPVAFALLEKRGIIAAIKRGTPIAWHGRPDSATPAFRTFPAHAVPVLPPAWFQDKIIVVGADLSDMDRHGTPFRAAADTAQTTMPGPLIHAHVIAQLLQGRQPAVQGVWIALLGTLAAAMAGMLLGRLDVALWLRMGLSLVVLAGIWLAALLLFRHANFMVPIIAPSLGFGLALWLSDLQAGRQEREQKKFIQAAFSKYLSPALLDDILKDPSKLQLDPKRRDLSYIFTDVAGFTTISESMDAVALSDVMNRYLDGMVNIIFRHGGTVDKFIGDAVFALFNAPRDQKDHTACAVACALELDAFAQSFLAAEQAAGRAFGVTRIGVHAGPASVGNFGAEARFEYTALGDAVNTAARLEGLNKYFGTRVAMSGTAAARCPDIARRPIGQIVLKGKTEPIPVFQPLSAEQAEGIIIRRYQQAYGLMATGDPAALEAFAALAADAPDDGPTALHLTRLQKGETGDMVVMGDK
jgi:class 3 adenylate cyclase/CHASE2 domain-containing sensor protein